MARKGDGDKNGPGEPDADEKAVAAKLGSGTRFKKLSKKLASGGAKNPDALAAYIGRKKYGAKKFAHLAKGRRK